MRLYTFFQSGSAYRVRIALALKGLAYEPVYVVGGRGSADLRSAGYLAPNPSAQVPTLVDGDTVLTQTLAIMEYLEERHPEPPLLPADPPGRARMRVMAQVIAGDTHPLSSARVIDYLDATLGLDGDGRAAWLGHWNQRGFQVIERMVAGTAPATGDGFCHGPSPTMADIVLVSQVFVAGKFGVDLAPYPTVRAIHDRCMALPAFADTAPEKQPDAVAD